MQIVPSGGQVFSVTQEHEVVNWEAQTIQTEFCFAFELTDSFPLHQTGKGQILQRQTHVGRIALGFVGNYS